jgi:hypothetical protein
MKIRAAMFGSAPDGVCIPLIVKLDVGVRLGAQSRQVRSYGHFIKKVKFKYKYDNILYVHSGPVDLL